MNSFFDLPAVKLAQENPNFHLGFESEGFKSREKAERFLAGLQVNPAIPKGCSAMEHVPAKSGEKTVERKRAIKGSALKTMERAIAGGDPIAQPAIDWAMASYWASECSTLEDIILCLQPDLEDGNINGAASAAQAEQFLKRLKAAVRYEIVKETETTHVPEKWVVKYYRNANYGPDVAGPWAKH
jgi:hypothetical protein